MTKTIDLFHDILVFFKCTCISPDLRPIEHMWGIIKQNHVSNIQQLHDVIMEEWKRMPPTACAALVNSMPRRIKAVLDNNGAPTKY